MEVKINQQELRLEPSDAATSADVVEQHFKLSSMRWPLLVAVFGFGFLNSIASEASVLLDVYREALGLDIVRYVYWSQLFFFVPLVGSFLAASLVDRMGLRFAIFTALAMVVLGNLARALLFSPATLGWHHLRYAYWACQKVLTQGAVILYYCFPLKLSESWFADDERTLALNLMLAVPVVGSALAQIVYPYFVVSLATARPIVRVNLATALASVALVAACVRRSLPPGGPPSLRNKTNLEQLSRKRDLNESCKLRLGAIIAHRQYLIQLFTAFAFDPLMGSVQSVILNIFHNAGLSGVFCGQFLAVGSILLALTIVLSAYLWRWRQQRHKSRPKQLAGPKRVHDRFRTRTNKILLALQCISFLALCQTLILHEWATPSTSYASWVQANQWWVLIVAIVAYMLIQAWSVPYINEQLAELICGQISEPTSCAMTMSTKSVYMELSAMIFVHLRQSETTTSGEHASYKYSILYVSCAAILLTLINICFFKPAESRAAPKSALELSD